MQIQNLLTLLLFLVGTTTYAQDPFDTTNDIFKCRAHHNSTVVPGNTDITKADAWCKNHMGPAVFCAEQELIKMMQKSSFTQEQLIAIRPQLKQRCMNTLASAASVNSAQAAQLTYAQGAQQAQLQQAQAAAAAEAAAKQNQANAAQAQQDRKEGLQQTAQLLGAASQVAEKVETAYDKAVAAQAAKASGTAPTTTANPPSSTAAPPQQPASATVVNPADGRAPTSVTGTTTTAPTTTPPATTATVPQAPPPPTEITVGGTKYTDESLAAMKPEERAELFAQREKELAAEAPGLSKPAADTTKAAEQGGDIEAPKSEITLAAEKADGELKTQLESTTTAASTKIGTTVTADFTPTATAIKNITPVLEAYAAVKKTCVVATEKTEFLCMEGTSPGAVAAKTLVSAAGPILAAVNSAQKACSNTSKVTGMAGMALTVAKGVCMASQVTCTTVCSAALAKLNAQIKTYTGSVTSAAGLDKSKALGTTCPALLTGYAACLQEAEGKFMAAEATNKQVLAIAQKEAAPTPGTTAGLAAKCKLKIADAINMAVNIGSLMLAKKNADECDRKLATAGTAGGGATVTQYCEKPENTTTQFCKCQKTPNVEGCPGFTASNTSSIDKEKVDQNGLNLKGAAGGKSSFAGGDSGDFKPDGSLASKDSGLNASSDASLSQAGSTAATTSNAAGGATSASAGAGLGGGRASDGSAGAEKEKKKWDFGSFAASVGNMFGGSKGGSKSNGSLSSSQSEKLERKIASDKLSAEISSASGKSNWEKIKRAYLIKESTLLTGQ